MTPEEWHKIKGVLGTALELEPNAREHFLDSACVGEGSIRREVESLLESHDEDAGFLEHPVAIDAAHLGASVTPENWIGRHLGCYELLEEVGAGGMGAVYRAVRADGQFDKQVAVKLIRSNLSTGFFVSRFKNERQILASLEHPNIARLIDGGVTEEGLPYLVLEFVAGEPIDQYCVRQDLSISERLKLFRTVCSAVQYAHKNLVVHRDLKPGNILVTEDRTPKLLDFGIAKILDPGEEETARDRTLTVMRIMTPDFASPEQVRGDVITTSSDIYSLGVILYLLLTGRRPYRVSSTAPHEIIRAICDTDPEKPSTAVTRFEKLAASAKSNSGANFSGKTEIDLNRKKLRRALSGDLDNIVLKALRKEPERRYATVEQLSEDVRRHLWHLPVIARKDTAGYLASKFIMRHKASVAAGVAVALMLIAALVIAFHEARVAKVERVRAERRFNEVRKLANSLLTEIHDSVATVPGTTAARRLIAQRSLDYLDSLAREAGTDPVLLGELADAYVKVGDVQGQSYNANLGDTEGALASYRKALAIREKFAALAPGDAANLLKLVRCHNKVGEMAAKMGDRSSASTNYKEALTLNKRLVAKDPSNSEYENELFLTLTRIGYLLEDNDDKPAALESHRQAIIAAQHFFDAHPSDPLACHDLATSYDNVGDLLAKSGHVREGLDTYTKGLAVCKWLSADDPNSTQANSRGWLVDYIKIGGMQTQLKNRKEAFASYQKATRIAIRLHEADTNNVQATMDLADCYQELGDSQRAFGDVQAATKSYQQAASLQEQAHVRDTWNVEVITNLASSYSKLGQAYSLLAKKTWAPATRVERLREARSSFEKSWRLWVMVEKRHILPGSQQSQSEIVAKEITKCDVSLARLEQHE